VNFPSLGLFIRQLCANSQQSGAAVQLLLQTEGSVLNYRHHCSLLHLYNQLISRRLPLFEMLTVA